MATEPMTARELAEIRAWESAATAGPWEQGVAFEEAPANPGAVQWAAWGDVDHLEPDLLWQVGYLPAEHCRLCQDGPPLLSEEREVPVRLYRTLQRGAGKECVGQSSRRVAVHLHRIGRNMDAPLEPISSLSARQTVLGTLTDEGVMRLVLSTADAVFIARAREAVPRLLAEVERLWALTAAGQTGDAGPR